MKTGFMFVAAVVCLGGCASNPYSKLDLPYGLAWSASTDDSVLQDLSRRGSYQANPTDQHFCDAMCQYARHVESNRLIAEARRREQRQRLEETESAFDEYFEAEPEVADSLPPVVVDHSLHERCAPHDDYDSVTPLSCN